MEEIRQRKFQIGDTVVCREPTICGIQYKDQPGVVIDCDTDCAEPIYDVEFTDGVSQICYHHMDRMELVTAYDGNTTEDTHESYTSHYTTGDIECVDYLWDNMPMEAFIGGLEWNTKKYLHRWRSKGAPVKDLRKARDYLTVLIDVMEGKAPNFKEWKADD